MSEIKVNKISPRAACGTVTLGDSGDSFTIPSGATITNSGTAVGFGATGSASWETTVKTSGFTAAAGEGYFVNTTSGPISVNLPAGTAGAVVAFKDYANTFDTHALTLVQNGSDKIGGSTVNVALTDEGIAVTLVFVDSTRGWLVTDSGLQSEAEAPQYIAATGGTVTTSGNFKIHTFTGPGTFCVSNGGNSAGSTLIDYVVVAGGGGSGGMVRHIQGGGGGGAGGFRASPGGASGCYAASPRGAAPAVSLPSPAGAYPITVGAGGTGGTKATPGPDVKATAGVNSVAALSETITAAGGGEGAMGTPSSNPQVGGSGGSGGGGAYNGGAGGTGNSPPVNPAQGNNGGAGSTGGQALAGSGGGATGAGGTSPPGGVNPSAGTGGTGATSCITASPVVYSTGGNYNSYNPSGWSPEPAATANTGNGGNGQNGGPSPAMPDPAAFNGVNGGSGIVIIRYKFQN